MDIALQPLPLIRNVFHCSDFSSGSHTAFVHALKAALTSKAQFTMLHVADDMNMHWTEFPEIRRTLERWGLLSKNSSRSAVSQLGIKVSKVTTQHDDPVESVLDWLERHPTDLLVLATQQDNGQLSWMRRSVAKPIARKSHLMTLMIPKGVKGFVSDQDGTVTLEKIVIPVAASPDPRPSLHAATRLVEQLNCPSGRFTVLHVGNKDSMPTIRFPSVPGWTWHEETMQGDVVQGIEDTVKKYEADLLVMTTAGRRGFLDALRGSHTEQVLRKVPCPLLTIPADELMHSVLPAESE